MYGMIEKQTQSLLQFCLFVLSQHNDTIIFNLASLDFQILCFVIYANYGKLRHNLHNINIKSQKLAIHKFFGMMSQINWRSFIVIAIN